jgi:hypothetical protein
MVYSGKESQEGSRMRPNYQTIVIGLDQLFFLPLMEKETAQDRADCIEAYLKLNGWTWDEYINELSKEETWIPLPSLPS